MPSPEINQDQNDNSNLDDNINDPTYHICVLQAMFKELSPGVRQPICDQFNLLIESIKQRDRYHTVLLNKIKDQIHTIGVDVKYLRFDLDATKREKAALQKLLDEKND